MVEERMLFLTFWVEKKNHQDDLFVILNIIFVHFQKIAIFVAKYKPKTRNEYGTKG
ncbi:MAG: hypothetical protein II521_05140 [Prevotella sp.]|nr:hypothetical protein [Prevotella sp.]